MAKRNANGVRRDKSNLPTKTCPVCKLPFTWRKAWARDWDRVVYCSDRCQKRGFS